MKIAVFSDSHRRSQAMLNAIETCSPDMIIHLGDGEGDTDKIKRQFPQIPLKAVRGNCDFNMALPESLLLELNGVRIYMSHGHYHGVKNGLASLLNAAHFSQADFAMYGHTHIAHYAEPGGMRVLNPGSCGLSLQPSWAEVIIDEAGGVQTKIIKL